MTKKGLVAYYSIPKKKGLSLESQKAIVAYFANLEKADIVKEFIATENQNTLPQAIAFAKKHHYTFIVAKLDCLSIDLDFILSVKKKLGGLFQSCDLPANDSLTISIAHTIGKRNKLLASIKTKAALQTQKNNGRIFGNPQNLTTKGRQLGLTKMNAKTENNPESQKILAIIHKCRAAGMGRGKIAKSLNELGFRTKRGKVFYKQTVKRLTNKFL